MSGTDEEAMSETQVREEHRRFREALAIYAEPCFWAKHLPNGPHRVLDTGGDGWEIARKALGLEPAEALLARRAEAGREATE